MTKSDLFVWTVAACQLVSYQHGHLNRLKLQLDLNIIQPINLGSTLFSTARDRANISRSTTLHVCITLTMDGLKDSGGVCGIIFF